MTAHPVRLAMKMIRAEAPMHWKRRHGRQNYYFDQ
jgi:hypothetical protein